MRKLLAITILLVLVLAVPAAAFRITGYGTQMLIQPDSNVIVTEMITADFTGDPHHGIYRDIPLTGKDTLGNTIRIRCELLGVTDTYGKALQVQESLQRGNLHLRIGDPNVLLDGIHTYLVRYKLRRAVHFFKDHDEIYWNVVGSEWEVPIDRASCTVVLPSDVQGNNLWATSYTGVLGSTGTDALARTPDKHTAYFEMTRTLYPGEYMTVVVGWPKGMVQQPSMNEEIMWYATDNGFFFIPPIFLLGLVGMWWKLGRDPDTGKSVMVTYDPPDNLRPAEIGTLIDEKADMRDISASIIDLAVRGFLRITASVEKGFLASKTDYKFELVDECSQVIHDSRLSEYEKMLLSSLFKGSQFVWVSSLSGNFYDRLGTLRDTLYDSMLIKGFFTHRPDGVRRAYLIAGGVIAALGVPIIFRGLPTVASGWGWAVSLCGIMLAAASKAMPRKTSRGKNVLQQIRGFEEYLSRAEREQIIAQERQDSFEKYLPYAMAFGIADKWAKAFDGLQKTPPNWYSGSDDDHTFRPSIFASDMSHAASSWGSSMSSMPRSSGYGDGSGGGFFGGDSGFSDCGGFSGGGGGGGGGGGW